MKLVTKRQARVGDLIKQTIAELVQRKVKDPRVDGVTITGVDVSVDLRVGHVFYCVLDPDRQQQAQQGLTSAAGFLRRELSRELRIKHIPELSFIYDESFDYGSKIDEILEKLEKDEKSDS
ncbi:MAG TPA: 30S ribosome-binding factor RbfA [Deltaproteobacteria bacterium]|jgi:ribosome-binding factor A|nr:30S ribosome-binding factor RbfA [Pseudomonadota bacterium]NLW67504.1 30S ribosome-binding factor RbfA [Bacteriovoracaceae bacterium]HOD70299.1 30S ribosome-binding factor RbfA [Deltaproteobacteria bacterium]HRR20999.1 30S ribosome-binding factor RbfA [Desulfomonilia bacterium]HOS28918.1 30S ribosome-binding factor RbfA [Deltaproteobacteria bacterium]